jgi:hypothetical protein
MNQNVWKIVFGFERTKQKSEENNTFENWEKLELKTPCREEHFRENNCKLSEKARKQWKIFYGASSLFIGARGGGFKKTASIWPLREIRRTSVHSDVTRVSFFTRIQEFSWNQIVGVNPLPRGASVGELGKNLTPSKCRVCRNSWDKFANRPRDESTSFVKVKHSWRDLDKFQVFFWFSNNVRKW